MTNKRSTYTAVIRDKILRAINAIYFARQTRRSFNQKNNLPIFIVVTPAVVHLAERSAAGLPPEHCPTFILNGVNGDDTIWLKSQHPRAQYIQLKTSISGKNANLVSHGEVIDLIGKNTKSDFCLMDADNFILDHSILDEINLLTENEFAAGPFIKNYDEFGRVIPETFLVTINGKLFQSLRTQHNLTAEVTRVPHKNTETLLRIAGFPNGTFPEKANDFWDTLQMYWCISQHLGKSFRATPGENTKTIHIGGTSYLNKIGGDEKRWNYLPLAVHYLNLRLLELPEMARFKDRFSDLTTHYGDAKRLLLKNPEFKQSIRFETVNRVIESCFSKAAK